MDKTDRDGDMTCMRACMGRAGVQLAWTLSARHGLTDIISLAASFFSHALCANLLASPLPAAGEQGLTVFLLGTGRKKASSMAGRQARIPRDGDSLSLAPICQTYSLALYHPSLPSYLPTPFPNTPPTPPHPQPATPTHSCDILPCLPATTPTAIVVPVLTGTW